MGIQMSAVSTHSFVLVGARSPAASRTATGLACLAILLWVVVLPVEILGMLL